MNSQTTITTRTDASLARATQQGDREAFVEIVKRFQSLVCGVAYGILNDYAASEDVAQEAFVTAWQKIGDLRDPERLRPWLARITRNVSLRQRRGRKYENLPEELNEAADISPLPNELTASDEEAQLVRDHLRSLPEKYRLPLVLFYREGQSVRLVAEALEISEDTVRQRLSRGRAKLRESLCHLIEPALKRSGPGAMFTTSVTAAILGLKPSAAVAASTFSSSSSVAAASSSAALSTGGSAAVPFLTTMTATKIPYLGAALIAAVCLPLGYTAHMAFEKNAEEDTAKTISLGERGAGSMQVKGQSKSKRVTADPMSRLGILERIASATLAELPDLSRELIQGPSPASYSIMKALLDRWVEVDAPQGFAFILAENTKYEGSKKIVNQWTSAAYEYCGRWALVDPSSAFLAAQGIEDKKITDVAMDRISMSLATHRPADFFHILGSLGDKKIGDYQPIAIRMFAISDLQGAIAAIEKVERPGAPLSADLASGWAKQDPDSALAWVRNLDGLPERARALRAIAKRLIDMDSERAAALYKEAENLGAADIEAKFSTNYSYDWRSAVEFLGESDPAAAVAWTIQHYPASSTEIILKFLPRDGVSAVETLAALPDTALRGGRLPGWPADTWKPNDLNVAFERLSEMPDSNKRESIHAWLLSTMVESDPEKAVDRATRHLSEEAYRMHIVENGVEQWARENVSGAVEWISTRESGAETDAAITGLLRVAKYLDPESALEWAATISDSRIRIQQLESVYRTLLRSSGSEAARAAFAEAPLSADDVETLKNKGTFDQKE